MYPKLLNHSTPLETPLIWAWLWSSSYSFRYIFARTHSTPFWQYLSFCLAKFKKWGLFWNLQVLRISKLSLLLIFGHIGAEIFEVKDTRGHFQFLHFYAWFYPVLAVRITLLDFQNWILHLAILSVIFSIEMTPLLTKKY